MPPLRESVRTYPTREAALAALAAARTKAGECERRCGMAERVYEPMRVGGEWYWVTHPEDTAHHVPREVFDRLAGDKSETLAQYPTREAALAALAAARTKAGGGDGDRRAELLAACKAMLAAVGDCGYECRQLDVMRAIDQARAAIAKAEAAP